MTKTPSVASDSHTHPVLRVQPVRPELQQLLLHILRPVALESIRQPPDRLVRQLSELGGEPLRSDDPDEDDDDHHHGDESDGGQQDHPPVGLPIDEQEHHRNDGQAELDDQREDAAKRKRQQGIVR
jgi:hypothetical protein